MPIAAKKGTAYSMSRQGDASLMVTFVVVSVPISFLNLPNDIAARPSWRL